MNEHELIQLLRKGDEPAFRQLVEAYRDKIFHAVLGILHSKTEAEDTTQDVFIQLYESIGQFKEASSLSTWIYRIAVRKALDKLRRKKTRQRLQQWLPWWMPDENKSSNEHFCHPGIALDKKEKATALFAAINALPAKQQVAFTLIKVYGMSYAEASDIMKQGIKAIESLISRATRNLQQLLEQEYGNK